MSVVPSSSLPRAQFARPRAGSQPRVPRSKRVSVDLPHRQLLAAVNRSLAIVDESLTQFTRPSRRSTSRRANPAVE